MSKIQVLDKHTAELIAAGEVVERPASAVKELVENSIDAGATAITVEIRGGGIAYIGITDNGEGIAREDVPVAFLRHATSKVRTAADLDSIRTLGFRGEALASIAAVSRVELRTRREEDVAGTGYLLDGGEVVDLTDIGCAKGTVLMVRDLFYNIPARMKFLKKDVSEGNAVAAVVERLALSHPEIAVRFVRDGREELHTAGDGDLHGCIYAVLGRDFAKGLLPLKYEQDGVGVTGYICPPSACRATRTMQHFFVNGRYVKTRTGMAALEQAYKGRAVTGKFPAGVLFLTLPPETVDANVHPAKIEVRFLNEKPVFSAVYHGVCAALEGQTARKAVTFTAPEPPKQLYMAPPASIPAVAAVAVSPQPPVKSAFTMPTSIAGMPVMSEKSGEVLTVCDMSAKWSGLQSVSAAAPGQPIAAQPPAEADATKTPPPAPETWSVTETPPAQPVRCLGEAFGTYLVAQQGDRLYIIDKHAAHERILYDQLRQTPEQEQQTIVPLSVTLSREEHAALTAELDTLRQSGFDVEDFGGSEVLVRAVPLLLADADITAMMQELAAGFVKGLPEVTLKKREWIYHSVACRAAVKAGDRTGTAEAQKLAERVLLQDDVRTCPHGRPVCIEMSKKELEKQFDRTL